MSRAVELTDWWNLPPAGRLTYLAGVDPELARVGLDPLPAGAPAVVSIRPARTANVRSQVGGILDELERCAIALFPYWLPGAERITGAHPAGVAAVRAVAERAAAETRNFGPFLRDLAERGLRTAHGAGPVPESRFAAQVRAAGLARVLASAYDRGSTALLVDVAEGLFALDERVLVSAVEWLVQRGGFTVWLAGARLRVVDRVQSIAVPLPADLVQLAEEARTVASMIPAGVEPDQKTVVATFPPLSGIPRATSPAEQALERALSPHEWATGRRWNHVYEPHILGKQYRLDLFWAAEGVVVEVDGDDHRGAVKFADDRRRDVHLQIRGFDVLRFTNHLVLADAQLVIHEIRQVLARRRGNNFPPH